MPVEPLNFSVAATQQMEQQSQRGAGVVRTAMLAVNIVRQKHRLHFFRFIMAIEKIAEASGEERDKLGGFIALHSAESFSHAQEFEPAPDAADRGIGRRLQKERLKITRQFLQLIVHAQEGVRVARRKLAEFGDGALAISPPRHHLPIRKRHQQAGIARNHFQSVRAEIEIANNRGPQHARDIRSGGGATARRDFFRDAAAAHNFAALHDERGKSRARKICGGRQAVVARADDDRIIGLALRKHLGLV